MTARAFGRVVEVGLRGRRRLGTVLFVGVVALAAAAIVAGLASRARAETRWDEAFDDANAPHVIVGAASADALAGIAESPDIAAASAPVAIVGGFRLEPVGEEVVARGAAPDDLPLVGAPSLVGGRLAASSDEMAVEKSFADETGIDIGDTVTLVRGSESAAFAVTGVVLDFQDCFFPTCDPGVTWLTPGGLDRLDREHRGYEVLTRLHDPSSAPIVAASLAAQHGASGVTTQDWIDTRDDALAVDDFFGAFLTSFGVFVLIAAGVVVAGAVTNRVVARRRDIGLLKSTGVTPRQIVAAMTVEHLALGLLGVLLGWLLGLLLLPQLQIGVAEVLGAGSRVWALDGLAGAAVAIGLIVALATVLPAQRVARRSAAAALGADAPAGGRSRLARLAARAGAGPVGVGGLKDAFGRPLRTVLVATSVVLAVVALLVTLGFDHAIDRGLAAPETTGDPWDAAVVPADPATLGDLDEAINALPEVAATFGEAEQRALVDGHVVLVRAIAGDRQAAGYVIREGRALASPGEAIAGFGLLELLGKGIGDAVDVEVAGEELSLTIVGRYAETEDSGEVLQMRFESLQQVLPAAVPDVIRAVAADGVSLDQLAAALAAAVGDRAQVSLRESDADAFGAFSIAFWSVALLVLLVALANLGATVLLGVRERARELGTLRTVGYTPAQLVAATAVGAAAVVIVALVVGVPLGLALNRVLLESVGEDIGAGPELAAAPTTIGVIATIVVVGAAAIGIAAAVCTGMARRSVSELVRYE